MGHPQLKMIKVRFEQMPDADEQALRSYINRELSQKKAFIDAADTAEKKQREDFRVRFREMRIKAVTEATQKIPQQELDVQLIDVSVGGCCIGLDQFQVVTKGGVIVLTLHFCQPPLTVRGEILGLRRD